MTTSPFSKLNNHEATKKRKAEYRLRRNRIMNSAWSDNKITTKAVEKELKINKSEALMLLRQMVDEGDLEKFMPEGAVFGKNNYEFRKRGNVNYWLRKKWRTG
jgi:predicted HTH transcriptional regulator